MELEILLGESFLTIFSDIFWGGEGEVPGESTLTKVLPVWNTFDWNSSTQFSFICAAITKFKKSRADVSKLYWTLNIWFSFLLLITLSNQNECRNSHIQKPQKINSKFWKYRYLYWNTVFWTLNIWFWYLLLSENSPIRRTKGCRKLKAEWVWQSWYAEKYKYGSTLQKLNHNVD